MAQAYIDSLDFQGMELDEAFRTFLQGFRLPREAQEINEIMTKFAERYWNCNPNKFNNVDTVFVLAHSLIMLNTDAHNPMVMNKLSANAFIGIQHGIDVPAEYLRSMYERITENEIQMKED